MGWETLQRWGDDATLLDRLAGGVANQVRRVELREQTAVGRLGTRSAADLAWETGLLTFLAATTSAFPCPSPPPTAGCSPTVWW